MLHTASLGKPAVEALGALAAHDAKEAAARAEGELSNKSETEQLLELTKQEMGAAVSTEPAQTGHWR